MMSLLKKVISGIQKRPFFIGIHGPAGVGKSTFASNAPNPLFLVTEFGGTDLLDVARLEIENWEDCLKALCELNNGEHDYKTIVIDSIDHLESKIFKMVAEDHKKKSIEDIGYAKGYIFALEYWHRFLFEIKKLRQKGMNVILIAHSHMKKLHDPVVGEDYDRYELKLHRKASDLITESMDALLFAKNDVSISKDSQTKKITAMGDGNRVLFTEHRPAFDAKNRYGLPLELPLSWSEFAKLALRSEDEKADQLHKQIWALMEKIDDEQFYTTVEQTVDKFKNNVAKLEEILTKLKQRNETND